MIFFHGRDTEIFFLNLNVTLKDITEIIHHVKDSIIHDWDDEEEDFRDLINKIIIMMDNYNII